MMIHRSALLRQGSLANISLLNASLGRARCCAAGWGPSGFWTV